MKKEQLLDLINLGLSTRQISEKIGKSQTTVRYYLKKHGLKTNVSFKRTCTRCESPLTGFQKKFCSDTCKNAKYQYSYQKRKRYSRKLELIKLKGGKCDICGYNKNAAALAFHHIIPENKGFKMNSRNLCSKSWTEILKESEKCQLLCHNCHMEIHHPDLGFLPSAGL